MVSPSVLQLCNSINETPVILKYSEDKQMIANCLSTKGLWSVLNKEPSCQQTWHSAITKTPANHSNKHYSQLIGIGLNLKSVVGKGYVQISSEIYFFLDLMSTFEHCSQERIPSGDSFFTNERKGHFKQTSCSNGRDYFCGRFFICFVCLFHTLLVLHDFRNTVLYCTGPK